MKKRLNLISRKMRGFKFEDTSSVCFPDSMSEVIGKIGNITDVSEDAVKVWFDEHSVYWWYPIDQVDQYLVEEGEVTIDNYQIY